jgi:SAM-dependent methyltransferase
MSSTENFLYNNLGKKNKSNRDIWLKKTLEDIPAGFTLLDAGAGEQQYRKFCTHLKYFSQDFELDIVSDINSIPVKNASFDVILCTEVFEHIPEPIKTISEFSRILKPGGKLILTLPVCSLTHFAPYYFYNGFSKYFLQKFLDENGLLIKEMAYNGNYYEFLAQELHRLPFVAERYSKFKLPFFKILVKIAFIPLMLILNWFSKRDAGSSELLSMGIHVIAIRK